MGEREHSEVARTGARTERITHKWPVQQKRGFSPPCTERLPVSARVLVFLLALPVCCLDIFPSVRPESRTCAIAVQVPVHGFVICVCVEWGCVCA